jgi:hypothetical protein
MTTTPACPDPSVPALKASEIPRGRCGRHSRADESVSSDRMLVLGPAYPCTFAAINEVGLLPSCSFSGAVGALVTCLGQLIAEPVQCGPDPTEGHGSGCGRELAYRRTVGCLWGYAGSFSAHCRVNIQTICGGLS